MISQQKNRKNLYIFPSFLFVRPLVHVCSVKTYILVSRSTPLAMTGPYGQLASYRILQSKHHDVFIMILNINTQNNFLLWQLSDLPIILDTFYACLG